VKSLEDLRDGSRAYIVWQEGVDQPTPVHGKINAVGRLALS
jgi:hypothetical protein